VIASANLGTICEEPEEAEAAEEMETLNGEEEQQDYKARKTANDSLDVGMFSNARVADYAPVQINFACVLHNHARKKEGKGGRCGLGVDRTRGQTYVRHADPVRVFSSSSAADRSVACIIVNDSVCPSPLFFSRPAARAHAGQRDAQGVHARRAGSASAARRAPVFALEHERKAILHTVPDNFPRHTAPRHALVS
jgi:hypothetical protein